MSGCAPNSKMRQPTTLIELVMNITCPFGRESANAPTKAASTTYDRTKNSFRSGIIQFGAWRSLSRAIAAMRRALSANDEKNCAAMME